MAIQLEQIESPPVLCYRFTGRITLRDMERLAHAEELYFTRLATGERLGIIADFAGLDTIAASLFPKLQQLHMACDERVGFVAVVGANPYLRALAISLGMLNGKSHFVFCGTMDEALTAVAARKPM